MLEPMAALSADPGSAAHPGACARAARSADPGVLHRVRDTRPLRLFDKAHPEPRCAAGRLTLEPRGAGPRGKTLVVVGGAGVPGVAMRAPAVLIFGSGEVPAAPRCGSAR